MEKRKKKFNSSSHEFLFSTTNLCEYKRILIVILLTNKYSNHSFFDFFHNESML